MIDLEVVAMRNRVSLDSGAVVEEHSGQPSPGFARVYPGMLTILRPHKPSRTLRNPSFPAQLASIGARLRRPQLLLERLSSCGAICVAQPQSASHNARTGSIARHAIHEIGHERVDGVFGGSARPDSGPVGERREGGGGGES